jgi:hypothetical protein
MRLCYTWGGTPYISPTIIRSWFNLSINFAFIWWLRSRWFGWLCRKSWRRRRIRNIINGRSSRTWSRVWCISIVLVISVIRQQHQIRLRRNVDRDHQDIFRREIDVENKFAVGTNKLVCNCKRNADGRVWTWFQIMKSSEWSEVNSWEMNVIELKCLITYFRLNSFFIFQCPMPWVKMADSLELSWWWWVWRGGRRKVLSINDRIPQTKSHGLDWMFMISHFLRLWMSDWSMGDEIGSRGFRPFQFSPYLVASLVNISFARTIRSEVKSPHIFPGKWWRENNLRKDNWWDPSSSSSSSSRWFKRVWSQSYQHRVFILPIDRTNPTIVLNCSEVSWIVITISQSSVIFSRQQLIWQHSSYNDDRDENLMFITSIRHICTRDSVREMDRNDSLRDIQKWFQLILWKWDEYNQGNQIETSFSFGLSGVRQTISMLFSDWNEKSRFRPYLTRRNNDDFREMSGPPFRTKRWEKHI